MAQTKHRYAYLDGMRGIAALFVVLRHTVEYWDFTIFRSYVAVDIFFVLSGFVIANAYAGKMAAGTLSLRGFFLVRLIRLYPVYALSLCLAIPLFVLEMTDAGTPLDLMTTVQLIILSMLFLPGYANPGGSLFPVNDPYWSLFFELAANIVYGILRPVLSTPVLLTIVVTLGVILCSGIVIQGNLNFGFLYTGQAAAAGMVRASFGIFLGVLMFAFRHRWPLRPRPWLGILLMCGVFLIPSVAGLDAVIDILAVVLILPACVMLAASTEAGPTTRSMLFLGSASYPIYVLHEPFGTLFTRLTDGATVTYASTSGWILLAFLVVICSLLEKKIDEPVRKWLARRLMKRPPPGPIQPDLDLSGP